MNMGQRFLSVFVLLLVLIPSLVDQEKGSKEKQESPRKQKTNEKSEVYVQPVEATEKNMILMMQVAYRPLFESLKKEIGVESKLKDIDYENVSRDALIIAELLARLHQWPDIGLPRNKEVRKKFAKRQKELGTGDAQSAAAAIYNAAGKKDFELARKSFLAMTKNCNRCHQKMKSSWVPVVLDP